MSNWIREGAFIYKLNANGHNEWIMTIRGHKDDKGKPTPLAAIESVATMAHAAPDMIEAMKPLVEFIEAFDRKPIYSWADKFYEIHTGTEWEAALRLSDLRKLRDAYNKALGKSPQSTSEQSGK